MIGAIRALRLLAAAAVVMVGMGVATPSHAQSGSVNLNIIKAGFIVGVGGGSGTLHYHGHTYRLSVGGIGVGSLGIAGVSLSGTASNLHHPSDIAGTYGAAGAGAAFVGGGQVATLQNEKGVVLTLHGPQVGFQLSLGLGGMTIGLR
ncbi:MAG: hypothetical protein WCA56_01920 [Xanthobacteraceae bacterium]|jgi:hypothetical protein